MLGGADNPNGELPSYITGANTQGASGHDLRKTLARKCSNPTRGEIPLPRPLAHYVRSLGLRRAVAALS
ncbi:TPA: hypothetical protein IF258_005231 [Escherichia coli]|nr:hypothetical protein [Escherichia coli]